MRLQKQATSCKARSPCMVARQVAVDGATKCASKMLLQETGRVRPCVVAERELRNVTAVDACWMPTSIAPADFHPA